MHDGVNVCNRSIEELLLLRTLPPPTLIPHYVIDVEFRGCSSA